jgi:EAL domain-containing protein (putative c-di-GMP-specific phosphodiesterase class I)/uncharacterized caspase-like protein
MTKTALVIGVSEYQDGLGALPSSVRDAEALQQVLQDPTIGEFHEVKVLRNPSSQEMQIEIEILFTEAKRDDLVLLYFSGHGIKDEVGKLHFATSETRKNIKNKKLVQATAVPASFVHDMMNSCSAKRQSIILDCCFSGAFDPTLAVKDDSSIDLLGQLGAEGRVVMASSSHIQPSFSRIDASSLSIYTSYLVEGLKTGEADLDNDGVISILNLHEYACKKARELSPNITPKLITFKDSGFSISLAKARISMTRYKNASKQRIDIGRIKPSLSSSTRKCDYLPSFLTLYEDLIHDLISHIGETAPLGVSQSSGSPRFEDAALNVIQDASRASFVLIIQSDEQGYLSVKAQSDFVETDESQKLIDSLISKLLQDISVDSIYNLEHHGIYKKYVSSEGELHSFFAFIPLTSQTKSKSKFMVIAGLPEDFKYLGDAYGRIVSSFYYHYPETIGSPDLLEASILDDLKSDYKFLSLALHTRRFTLFCSRLKKMTVYFEPILELDSLTISGWEALARDPDTGAAPYDIFHAAELWGVKFMIELDQHFLRVATEKYRDGRQEIKQNRPHEVLPLSVNVYPESLTRQAYFATVQQVVQEDRLIPGRKLILEISEKISLPKHNGDAESGLSWRGFKAKLKQYVKELNVKFAIDDFGVEHASVSHLAGLQPSYVKIDREILFHSSRDIIIKFVHDLGAASDSLEQPIVIVEGFDEKSPVSLGHLRDIGVNYIQGHIVGKAEPQIYRLSKEKFEELRGLLDLT